ncbi:MAG: hypothetical protein VKK62_09155 [Synechococcaceae cyanobacterium]|nr:hypothetical protein [Synechococcaceae cyanobacterium]
MLRLQSRWTLLLLAGVLGIVAWKSLFGLKPIRPPAGRVEHRLEERPKASDLNPRVNIRYQRQGRD